MRDGVKQKHFSTPLRGTSIGAGIQALFFFVERILVLMPEAPQTTGMRIRSGWFPLNGFMHSGPDTIRCELRKPTVGLSANHHPM